MLATTASLLNRIHTVPSLPLVVQALIATFTARDIDMPRIARLVKTDPMITAKVLRLVNSAYYVRSRSIASVNDAVVYLGLDALRMLVVGAGFAQCLPVPASLGRELFWRYCLHTAVAAKYFAAQCDEAPETAFTAGLLHAIGEPLMANSLPQPISQIDAAVPFFDHDRAPCERKLLGFSFADLGADLADSWCFPRSVIDAIRDAPAPLEGEAFSPLAGCVYLGAHFAAACERGESPEQAASSLDGRVSARMGIDRASLLEMPSVQQLAAGLEELVG